jgi:hypothetical protein
LEDLLNKIRDILGLIPQINHKTENNKDYLEIIVSASKNPVSFHGHFYYRSGSTIQDLSGGALEHFLLAKRGKKWDGVVAEQFTPMYFGTTGLSILVKRHIPQPFFAFFLIFNIFAMKTNTGHNAYHHKIYV